MDLTGFWRNLYSAAGLLELQCCSRLGHVVLNMGSNAQSLGKHAGAG